MKKIIIALCFLLSFLGVNAQGGWLKPSNSYGTIENRRSVDSTLFYPTGCGTPSLQGYNLRKSAFFYDSCNHRLWAYDPKLSAWDSVHLGSNGSSNKYIVGITGNNFNIVTSNDTVYFNIPDASDTARGLITTSDQIISGNKTFGGTVKAEYFYIGSLSGASSTDSLLTVNYSTGEVKRLNRNAFLTPSALTPYLTSATAAATYASLSGSYSNPSWITSLGWSKISSTPTTLSGYGITDATSNARSAFSLTTSGTGGASTYNSSTGVLNIPNYAQVDYSADNIWTGINTFKKDSIGTTYTSGIYLLNSSQTENQYSPGITISNYRNVTGTYKLNEWRLFSHANGELHLGYFLDGTSQINPFKFGIGGSFQANSSITGTSYIAYGGTIASYVDGTNTSRDGLILQPTSSGGASSGQPVKWSQRIRQSAYGWTGSTSQTASFIQEVRTTSGTNPITAQYVIAASVAGGSYNDRISITDGGNILIGTTTDVSSSILTTSSTTKGSLAVPRMTKTQRNSIASPPDGLMVIVTGESGGTYFSVYNLNQTRWEKMTTTAD